MGKRPAEGWTFPFRLRHIDLRGRVSPTDLLASLFTSSFHTLTSIDLSMNTQNLIPIFDLPSFKSIAPRILSLALNAYIPDTHATILGLFTSLTTLSFPTTASITKVVALLDYLPSNEPTIERLVLGARPLAQRSVTEFGTVVTHVSMTALKEAVFCEVEPGLQMAVLREMQEAFPAVKMAWGGGEPASLR